MFIEKMENIKTISTALAWTYRILALVLCSSLLCACSGDKSSSIKKSVAAHSLKKTKEKRHSATIKDLEKRLDELMKPIKYRYVIKGKPDPFHPFIKTTVNRAAVNTKEKDQGPARDMVCSTPLECMDIGQLTLVAVISKSEDDRIAMAQDAAGLGYMLKQGQRVGYKGGVVAQILPDRVVIEEPDENLRGEKIKVKRILVLHPEEQ